MRAGAPTGPLELQAPPDPSAPAILVTGPTVTPGRGKAGGDSDKEKRKLASHSGPAPGALLLEHPARSREEAPLASRGAGPGRGVPAAPQSLSPASSHCGTAGCNAGSLSANRVGETPEQQGPCGSRLAGRPNDRAPWLGPAISDSARHYLHPSTPPSSCDDPPLQPGSKFPGRCLRRWWWPFVVPYLGF